MFFICQHANAGMKIAWFGGFIDFLPYSSCPVCVSWNISQKDYSIQAVGSTRELTAKLQYDNRGLELDKARGRY